MDEARRQRIERWKDKLKMTLDADGNVVFGWGYPQEVHLEALEEVNQDPSPMPNVDDVLQKLEVAIRRRGGDPEAD